MILQMIFNDNVPDYIPDGDNEDNDSSSYNNGKISMIMMMTDDVHDNDYENVDNDNDGTNDISNDNNDGNEDDNDNLLMILKCLCYLAIILLIL